MREISSLALLLLSTGPMVSGLSVTLTPSSPTPALVGQMITWQADATGTGDLRYRFRMRTSDLWQQDESTRRRRSGVYQMIRDFSPATNLDWTASDHEGMYEMEVTVKDMTTGDMAIATMVYQFLPRANGATPVISSTKHPLVFLFSMPACEAGSRVRVEFRTGTEAPQDTPYQPCEAGTSMNFYLAGLRPNTDYSAHSSVESASGVPQQGPDLAFHTGAIPTMPWQQTIIVPATGASSQPVLLGTGGGSQIATDISGRVIWYNPSPFTWATRPSPGGYLWGVMEDPNSNVSFQSLREVDLTGMTVLETNAEAVNQQLVAMGKHTITGFHHEVRDIANDRIVALAGVEELLTDVQGPGTKDILGDMIVVFDRNLNVVWTWDAFDHLDVNRAATTNDVCTLQNSGCPAFYLAPTANDWTHGNAVQMTPDGQLSYSARHQDWVIKIDYSNGMGTGNILSRLGKDGDFTYLSNDPYPWFSHQHDPNFSASNPSRLIVFDNGNLRQIAGDPISRAQVIDIDPVQRTAKLVLNVRLGIMSLAVGSAQSLENGNYHFDAGAVLEGNGTGAYSFEIDPTGKIVFETHAATLLYRQFRMRDMYADAESQ